MSQNRQLPVDPDRKHVIVYSCRSAPGGQYFRMIHTIPTADIRRISRIREISIRIAPDGV